MARKAKPPALYTVTVRYDAKREPLVMNFIDRMEAWMFEMEAGIKFGRHNVSMSDAGYMIHKSAKEAMENLEFWAR